jgi:hypothetical protein
VGVGHSLIPAIVALLLTIKVMSMMRKLLTKKTSKLLSKLTKFWWIVGWAVSVGVGHPIQCENEGNECRGLLTTSNSLEGLSPSPHSLRLF